MDARIAVRAGECSGDEPREGRTDGEVRTAEGERSGGWRSLSVANELDTNIMDHHSITINRINITKTYDISMNECNSMRHNDLWKCCQSVPLSGFSFVVWCSDCIRSAQCGVRLRDVTENRLALDTAKSGRVLAILARTLRSPSAWSSRALFATSESDRH